MEIVLVWSWFAFFVGFVSAFFLGLAVAFLAAYGQYKKQQAKKNSVEALFGDILGKSNS
jgi:hypothetical protein